MPRDRSKGKTSQSTEPQYLHHVSIFWMLHALLGVRGHGDLLLCLCLGRVLVQGTLLRLELFLFPWGQMWLFFFGVGWLWGDMSQNRTDLGNHGCRARLGSASSLDRLPALGIFYTWKKHESSDQSWRRRCHQVCFLSHKNQHALCSIWGEFGYRVLLGFSVGHVVI